jgi:hypothetical protein
MPANDRGKLAELDPAGSGAQLNGGIAELIVAIGHLASQAKPGPVRPRIPWEACHPIGPIGALTITAGAGKFDTPDLLGPHDPYWWDLRRFAAWGFTAGTVNLFKNDTNGTQLGSLTAPGNITWSAQELLAPRDRLIVVASGVTGVVQFEVRAVEVESRWLPEYLM